MKIILLFLASCSIMSLSAITEHAANKQSSRHAYRASCTGVTWRPLQQEESGLTPRQYRDFKKAIKDKDSGATFEIRQEALLTYQKYAALRAQHQHMKHR